MQYALMAVLWGAAAIIAVVGIYYQSRARRYYRPPSLMARLSPVARFRLSNFAPDAAPLVARGRIAAFAFLCVVVGALALGQVGAAGATACPNPAVNRARRRRGSKGRSTRVRRGPVVTGHETNERIFVTTSLPEAAPSGRPHISRGSDAPD